jgi:hypothetical protein
MTPEERTLLTQFLNDLTQARGVAKDPEAASMIENAVSANPDGAYVLVQHALLADQALHQAQAQIAQLQQQLQQSQAQPAPSFLGGAGLGPSSAQPGYQAQPSSPWGQAAAPQGGQPIFGGGQPSGGLGGLFSGGGGLGSFLRTAGTTAAGVAGGEMLFSGLSNLFGGRHEGGFGGGFGGGGFGGQPVENVTINEYGDDQGGFDGGGYDDDYN